MVGGGFQFRQAERFVGTGGERRSPKIAKASGVFHWKSSSIPLRRFFFVPLVSPLFVSPRVSVHLLDSYNFTVGLVLERLSPCILRLLALSQSRASRPRIPRPRSVFLFYIKIRPLKTRRYTKSSPFSPLPTPTALRKSAALFLLCFADPRFDPFARERERERERERKQSSNYRSRDTIVRRLEVGCSRERIVELRYDVCFSAREVTKPSPPRKLLITRRCNNSMPLRIHLPTARSGRYSGRGLFLRARARNVRPM